LEGNDHGIDLYGSDDDFVKQNDFVENTVQARVQISGNNQWDDGSHGNYWSDYNGTDEDHNGVGNNPYIIDENNTDRCPSMTPYWG
jgi:nitrous oxidase accessory protein NosD